MSSLANVMTTQKWTCPPCHGDSCSPEACWGWNGEHQAGLLKLCQCERCGGHPNSLACKVGG